MTSRIALLGGRFSAGARLDDWVLDLVGSSSGRGPRVCFLPTATGDDTGWIERFEQASVGRVRPSVLRLFDRDGSDPAERLADQDVIFVGGGNTANMLAVWRVHGVDRALVSAYRAGTLLCGTSAGMICWFESCLTDSFGPLAPLPDGLGLLPGSACPHFDTEPARRPDYLRAVGSGTLAPGWALDDGAAALVTGGELTEVVSRHRDSHLYRVERSGDGGTATATALPDRTLPAGT